MFLTICYVLENTLYINLTNRCTNRCTFCVRDKDCGIGDVNLWLEREPTQEEIIADIDKFNPQNYDEVVFCGYGEPTMRLDVLLSCAKHIKEQYGAKVRINTNGQANLYYKKDITPQLSGLIDVVSISLNAKNAEEYDALCKSVYGKESFSALIAFAKACTAHVDTVIMSVVDILPKEDIAECRVIAETAGARLRVRSLIE
ncbi:MAG: radical SAM protein [Clostridia bacterium]|nr:radical SAM protein [Clostridia bacterium]